jgi:glycosyltransferase involved in cell wall biosynthesis
MSAAASPADGLSAGVAYVLETFPVPSERFIEREVRQVEQLGVPVWLCRLRGGNEEGARAGDPGREGGPVGAPYPPTGSAFPLKRLVRELGPLLRCQRGGPAGLLRWALVALGHARRLRRRRPALIHAHFGLAPAVVARFLGFFLGRPWGVSVHARDIYVTPEATAARLRGASHVVACSARAAADVQALLPQGPDVQVVHHGLTLESWPPRPTDPGGGGPPQVLAVGRLVPKKGFDVLVQACARLKHWLPDLRCTIVGAGDQGAELRALAHQLEAPVRILPWQSESALKELYRQATVLAVPCRVADDADRDNIPNVVVEAMATGLPVVAGAIPSLVELFRDSRAALLVPSDAPVELASAIAGVCREPSLATQLAFKGREFVEVRFDQGRNVQGLLEIFRRAAGILDRP